jgi:DNA modification methylase
MKAVESVQRTLFDDTVAEKQAGGHNGAGFADPSFAVNKTSPVHRWVPWIAGFSKDFVAEAIDRYLQKHGIVLDPFAGVGTTLLEAVIAGHDAVGFEINPYAALASKAKVMARSISQERLSEAIQQFDVFYSTATRDGYEPESTPPLGFHTRSEFYSPLVLRKVLIAQDFIKKDVRGAIGDLFALAFASTMVTYSNYSYEPSLSRRRSAGKSEVHDFDVGGAIRTKLHEMAEDVLWMSRRARGPRPHPLVFNDSFFNCRRHLSSGSVDLVVTSPPYLNNYHYNRNTRPHMYWLGFAESPKDFNELEQNNFGKYWQTVREAARIDLDFPDPSAEIVSCLNQIREMHPEKGIYGGNGWANYAASYFNDCYRFATSLRWALKRRGTALVVIGNNVIQGVAVPTDRFLGVIAESAGLKLVDIHIPRETRVGNSIIQSAIRVGKAQKSNRLYEAVVELRKR